MTVRTSERICDTPSTALPTTLESCDRGVSLSALTTLCALASLIRRIVASTRTLEDATRMVTCSSGTARS